MSCFTRFKDEEMLRRKHPAEQTHAQLHSHRADCQAAQRAENGVQEEDDLNDLAESNKRDEKKKSIAKIWLVHDQKRWHLGRR